MIHMHMAMLYCPAFPAKNTDMPDFSCPQGVREWKTYVLSEVTGSHPQSCNFPLCCIFFRRSEIVRYASANLEHLCQCPVLRAPGDAFSPAGIESGPKCQVNAAHRTS